jgi:hypothetical protein
MSPLGEDSWALHFRFELTLPLALSLSNFAERLIALDELYNELCNLLLISHIDEPLQISKIESGSLWIKIFGETRVISLITNFLEESAGYIYRTYTREGKIASIPKKIESLNEVINLSSRLKSSGVNTQEMDENLSKAGIIISTHLNTLLSGQPSIILNQKMITVGEDSVKGYLQAAASPNLLESPSQITLPEYIDLDTKSDETNSPDSPEISFTSPSSETDEVNPVDL